MSVWSAINSRAGYRPAKTTGTSHAHRVASARSAGFSEPLSGSRKVPSTSVTITIGHVGDVARSAATGPGDDHATREGDIDSSLSDHPSASGAWLSRREGIFSAQSPDPSHILSQGLQITTAA